MRVVTTTTVQGLIVGSVDVDESAAAVRRLTEALDLIAELDPRRMRRMRQDVTGILLRPSPTYAGLSIATRRCLLDPQWVSASPSATVALVLIHEAIHARLIRAGIPFRLGTSARMRVERVCIRHELAFLRILPRHLYKNIDELAVELAGKAQKHRDR